MSDIRYIINYTYTLLNNTYLSFSPFRFSLMSVLIGLAAERIVLISFFIRKFFVE
jgi:hypothetical protein